MKPTALQVGESDRHSERDSQEGGAQAPPSPGSLRVNQCSVSTSGQSVEGPGGIT